MKRKKIFKLPERVYEPKIFSNFQALDLNLRVMRSNQHNLLKGIGLYSTTEVMLTLIKSCTAQNFSGVFG